MEKKKDRPVAGLLFTLPSAGLESIILRNALLFQVTSHGTDSVEIWDAVELNDAARSSRGLL